MGQLVHSAHVEGMRRQEISLIHSRHVGRSNCATERDIFQ